MGACSIVNVTNANIHHYALFSMQYCQYDCKSCLPHIFLGGDLPRTSGNPEDRSRLAGSLRNSLNLEDQLDPCPKGPVVFCEVRAN